MYKIVYYIYVYISVYTLIKYIKYVVSSIYLYIYIIYVNRKYICHVVFNIYIYIKKHFWKYVEKNVCDKIANQSTP